MRHISGHTLMACCLSTGVILLAQAHVLALQLAVALAVAAFVCLMRPAQLPTYLVDFYCYRPPDRCAAALSCCVIHVPAYVTLAGFRSVMRL